MASRKPFDGVTTRGRRGEGGGGGFRGRNASSVVMKALAACLVMGLSGAQEPEEKDITLPSDYEVIHANIVMRHGQRSRLVKSTAMEFGDNDGVTVSVFAGAWERVGLDRVRESFVREQKRLRQKDYA